MSTTTLHDDPPRLPCHRCGLTSPPPDEGLVSLAQWRYAIGHRVRWAGDPAQTYTITSRRWVERQVMAPYAEYQIQDPTDATGWEVEADLDLLDDA